MKIGILGLQPRQIADLNKRTFSHPVFCYSEKGYAAARVGAFCRDKDRVLVFHTHLPRGGIDGVPADKRLLMTGSVSTALRYLEGLPKPSEDEVVTKQPFVAPDYPVKLLCEPEAVVEEKPAVMEVVGAQKKPSFQPIMDVTPLVSFVPTGRHSQYSLPKSDILINYPNSGGIQNYTILRAALPGDIVRFARPEGLSLHKWRDRIKATTYMYWQNHGLALEAHFFNEYVDIQIMRQDEVVRNTISVAPPEESAEDVEPRRAPRLPGETVVVVAEQDGIPMETADKAVESVQAVEEMPAAPVEALAPVVIAAPRQEPASGPYTCVGLTEIESGFWRQVFAGFVQQGKNAEQACAASDDAIRFHRIRCG